MVQGDIDEEACNKLALQRNRFDFERVTSALNHLTEKSEQRFHLLENRKYQAESVVDIVKRLQETFDSNYDKVVKNVEQQVKDVNGQVVNFIEKTESMTEISQANSEKILRMYESVQADISRLLAQD